MPGRGTEPGPALYAECGTHQGVLRHRREGTRVCAGCREDQRVAMHRYRIGRIVQGPRLVSTLGMRRRVRALARRGWSQDSIAERLGLDPIGFKKIVQQAETRREVVEKVTALYRELWDQEGPSPLTRKFAERRGWAGPMDWDDPDNPDEVPACEVERAHAEALVMDRARRKNEARRVLRQTGRDRCRQTEMMMA